jgi:hypothetical protein
LELNNVKASDEKGYTHSKMVRGLFRNCCQVQVNLIAFIWVSNEYAAQYLGVHYPKKWGKPWDIIEAISLLGFGFLVKLAFRYKKA